MGLLDYDMDALEKWVGETLLSTMRSSVRDNRQNPVSILADFITDNINNTLVVAEHTRQGKEPPVGMPDPYVSIEPRGSLQIRRELDSNTVVFKKAALTRWADSHGVSASTLLDDLKGYPNASITNTLMDLGQESNVTAQHVSAVYLSGFRILTDSCRLCLTWQMVRVRASARSRSKLWGQKKSRKRT